MNPDLKQFARQLKDWSQPIIDHGRTPFRRVDCWIPIATDMGSIIVPLIYWINKQSLMAGGIILLPEQDLAAELQRGRSCAAALGVSHFVTWEKERVRLWRVTEEQIDEQRSFSLAGTEHPDYFRILLSDVIDALKLPAITGTIPADKLSDHYFINLFRVTLWASQPFLDIACRRQRAEQPASSSDDSSAARDKNRLTLLNLLLLCQYNPLTKLPQPEHLMSSIAESTTLLPEPLQFFSGSHNSRTTMPPEAVICFHHLLLRLQQLSWPRSGEDFSTVISHLMEEWYQPGEMDSTPVSIHPQGPVTNPTAQLVVCNSPLLLATTAALRHIKEHSQPDYIQGSTLAINPEQVPQSALSARLLNCSPVSKNEAAMFSARLRLSWPHRSFKITAGQPLWTAELLHLLGICPPLQPLTAICPATILHHPAADPLWTVLAEQYRIVAVTSILPEGTLLRLELIRAPQDEHPIRIVGTKPAVLLSSHYDDDIRSRLKEAFGATTACPAATQMAEQKTGGPEPKLRRTILQQLLDYGVPSFPDQYLYFLEQPEMASYTFTPPLREVGSFLGQFELRDADDRTIVGYGEELKQALLLCALSGKKVFDLPVDRHQLATLLQHYHRDLESLYQYLASTCFAYAATGESARRMIKGIWKKLHLPDLDRFKN